MNREPVELHISRFVGNRSLAEKGGLFVRPVDRGRNRFCARPEHRPRKSIRTARRRALTTLHWIVGTVAVAVVGFVGDPKADEETGLPSLAEKMDDGAFHRGFGSTLGHSVSRVRSQLAQICDLCSEFSRHIAPAYHHDRCERYFFA